MTIVEVVQGDAFQVEVYEPERASDALVSIVESMGLEGDCYMIGVGDVVLVVVDD